MTMKGNILDLEARRQIYNFIREYPGLHLKEISRKLKIPFSACGHHLYHLEKLILASCLGGPIRFLNPVASLILEFSNGQNTVDSIIKKVLKNADKKQVEKDVISFLIVLKENKIIEYQ